MNTGKTKISIRVRQAGVFLLLWAIYVITGWIAVSMFKPSLIATAIVAIIVGNLAKIFIDRIVASVGT